MKTAALVTVPLALLLASATVVSARRASDASAGGRGAAPAAAPASSPASRRVAAEGRVVAYPGAEVVVGTDYAGRITRLEVDEKSAVKKGQLLAELDADEPKAALKQARARISECDADVKLAAFEESRARQLLESRAGSRQSVDKAERDLEAARARRATAAADAERLAAQIAKARILAPISGVVVARHAQPGETVDRGAKLVTLVDLTRLRVEAEVDEADASRVAVGAKAIVRAEGERTGSPARVEEVPDAVTGRRTKPQDPGKPSDTRVLLVKLAFDAPARAAELKLGRRVEVELEPVR